jgi:hypothetical protein
MALAKQIKLSGFLGLLVVALVGCGGTETATQTATETGQQQLTPEEMIIAQAIKQGISPEGKKLYYFLVFSNATPGMEEEYNRWYDKIHAPVMIEQGDFIYAQRFAVMPRQPGQGRSQTCRA